MIAINSSLREEAFTQTFVGELGGYLCWRRSHQSQTPRRRGGGRRLERGDGFPHKLPGEKKKTLRNKHTKTRIKTPPPFHIHILLKREKKKIKNINF